MLFVKVIDRDFYLGLILIFKYYYINILTVETTLKYMKYLKRLSTYVCSLSSTPFFDVKIVFPTDVNRNAAQLSAGTKTLDSAK